MKENVIIHPNDNVCGFIQPADNTSIQGNVIIQQDGNTKCYGKNYQKTALG